jgi:hypothetical protein
VTRAFPVALVAGLAAVLLILLPGAGATTGVEVTTPVAVTLTDKGVHFSHRLHPTTDTTIRVKVTNRSSTRRWFRLGWRKTHTLQRGGTELFYYSFNVPGRTAWRSQGAAGKTFHGTMRVKLGTPYGIG